MKVQFSQFVTKYRKGITMFATMFAVTIALLFFGITGYAAVNAQATATPTNTFTPSPTNTLTPTPLATGIANPQGSGFVQYLICGNYSFGQITPGSCLQVYNGSDIEVFSSAGRRTWYLDGETGNVTAFGSVSSGASGWKCVHGTQSITGSGTAIPATLTAAGISTPQVVIPAISGNTTGDINSVSASRGSGVVTFLVWNSALTPVAASGAATIDYQVCGN